jgi:hypothetical protein
VARNFQSRSVAIDDDTLAQCQTLAKAKALNVSCYIRLLIKDAFEKHQEKECNESMFVGYK